MKSIIPDFLLEAIGEKDITVDFTKFLISQAEEEIKKEQEKIAELQKQYKVAAILKTGVRALLFQQRLNFPRLTA